MSFTHNIAEIIRTLGPAQRQMMLRSSAKPVLQRSSWTCGCVVDVIEDGAPSAQWNSCAEHAGRGLAAPPPYAGTSSGPLAASLSAFSVNGKRLATADAWTFDCFMSHLEACAADAQPSERRDLAQLFLKTLPEAVIRRRCNCGDRGCRTYFFVDSPAYAADIAVLDFPTRPGDYLLIVYAPNRKLLSVELYIDD